MTEIDELEGRALDIAVGSVLFEHITINPEWYRFPVEGFFDRQSGLMVYSYDTNGCNALMFRNGESDSDGTADPLPYWSDDIAQAWELVEELWELGNNFAINRLFMTCGQYAVSVDRHAEDRICELIRDSRWETTSAATAPTAICRAYLKAKEAL